MQRNRQTRHDGGQARGLFSTLRGLNSGYTYVTAADGTVIQQVSGVRPPQDVVLHFADGTATAQITATKKGQPNGNENK